MSLTGIKVVLRNRFYCVPVYCLLTVLFLAAFTNPAAAKNFLWQVKSPSTTVYLFGSIHYAKSGMYPLDAAIENAFAGSSNLVLELNPLTVDQAKLAQELLAQGMYSGDRTIKDDLNEETFMMLREYLQKAGFPIDVVMKMKPALLALTLSSLELVKNGYNPQQGIDIYFAKKAENSKTILELESAKQQIDLLLNLPDANLLLAYTIKDISKTGDQIDQIVNYWKAGAADKINEVDIEESLRENPQLAPIMEEILFKRNITMTEKIKGYLATDKTYFVVVGAAHFVGNRGIVKLLKKAGYTVKQF
jgi:uncharacterized protein